jgi:hypothetical protein
MDITRTHRSVTVLLTDLSPRVFITAHLFDGPHGRVVILAPGAEGGGEAIGKHFRNIYICVITHFRMEDPDESLWIIGPDPGAKGLTRVAFDENEDEDEHTSMSVEIQAFPTELLAELLGPFESYGKGLKALPPI